jgi:hypothetical protein
MRCAMLILALAMAACGGSNPDAPCTDACHPAQDVVAPATCSAVPGITCPKTEGP